MSLNFYIGKNSLVRFPRSRGDEPRRLYLLGTVREFSPLTRG